MRWAKSNGFGLALAGLLPLSFLLDVVPARAASALAAWSLGNDGVLQLRTSKEARLKAFFQSSDLRKGARVWIDFPGELVRPRSLVGSGAVREIRLGKPAPGVTRLVIELNPSVELDPKKLQLVGTSPDRWKLSLVGLPVKGLRRIGEGDLIKPNANARSSLKKSRVRNTQIGTSLKSSDLPQVRRGKYLVVIDPGHGGPDPGAIGVGGLKETSVVLDISLMVSEYLKSKGVNVKLTRTSEIDLDLPPRVAIANRLGANAFISIHANASRTTRRDVNGIETFYFAGSRGLRLAKNIQQELLVAWPQSPDRGVRRGRFFVIRRTTMPAALVETGFVTGRRDAPLLSTPSHRRKIAFAISKGILNYLRGGT